MRQTTPYCPKAVCPPTPLFLFGCYYNSLPRSNNFISGRKPYEDENFCWWSLTGLVEWEALCVPFIFHSAHPLRVPLDLHNAPCGRLRQIPSCPAKPSSPPHHPWDLSELFLTRPWIERPGGLRDVTFIKRPLTLFFFFFLNCICKCKKHRTNDINTR